MKKHFFIIMMMVLAVGFTTACSSDSDGDDGLIVAVEDTNNLQETRGVLTPETDVDESVVAFFNQVSNEGTYYFAQQYEQKDACLIFNSEEDIETSYSGSNLRALPKIDFSKYTVIVGQRVGIKMFCEITSQQIHEAEDGLVLDLFITDYSDIYNTTTAPAIQGFWGLYPKLNAKSVRVNEVYVKAK